MKIVAVLNAHENSPVFKDTLESIRHYLTEDVLVVVDGKNWNQFKSDDSIPAFKLEGFHHGEKYPMYADKYRNTCLGMMKAWEMWGYSANWYFYLEYDALVGPGPIREHLNESEALGFWLLGSDYRQNKGFIPFLEDFQKHKLSLHYLIGCCLFFSRDFMKALHEDNFFDRFLNFTNFRCGPINIVDGFGKSHPVYDFGEFLYPTLAVHYGGAIKEISCWKAGDEDDDGSGVWYGDCEHYPIRFRPDLTEAPFPQACVMHPMKDFHNPVRSYHRESRKLETRRRN